MDTQALKVTPERQASMDYQVPRESQDGVERRVCQDQWAPRETQVYLDRVDYLEDLEQRETGVWMDSQARMVCLVREVPLDLVVYLEVQDPRVNLDVLDCLDWMA